jgi:Zn-dependent M28 family amino/carboxypeptidase
MTMDNNCKLLALLMTMLILCSFNGDRVAAPSSQIPVNILNQGGATVSRGEISQAIFAPPSTNILYLSNLTTLQSTAKHTAELANTSMIQSIVSYVSSFDNRYTGTQGSINSVSYIQRFLRLNCSIDNVNLDNFTFNDQGTLIQASNVIAKIDAANPTLKTLLVTAHHDSIGYQYPFNVYSDGAKGADDDASGVGAVLETARVLSTMKQYLKYNVLFIIFAAEEGNKTLDPAFMHQGSTHWISTTHVGVNSVSDIIGAVNLDQVAYKYGGSIGIYHYNGGNSAAVNMTSATLMLGVSAQDEGHARSDSYLKPVRCRTEDSFDSAGIPAITLSADHPDPFTHTTQDTLSNLDFKLACNFTKTVLCYAYLTCGLTPKPVKTYTESWSSAIDSKALYRLNETNYIDVLMRPNIVTGYQLIALDPSLGGMNKNSLLSLTTAFWANGKKLPVLSLGRIGLGVLDVLTQNEVEGTEQNTSNHDVVAYVGNTLTGLSHHPVFNSPSNITLTCENDTTLSYKVEENQPNGKTTSCYLVRNKIEVNPPFLELSYILYGSKVWTWLGVLHTYNTSCGPVAFIGIDNASSSTETAKRIVGNTVSWLLNIPRTVTIIEPSEKNPLVGDHVNVNIALRNSLAWSANSSIPISLKVTSPSGIPLLKEMRATDQNGIAKSSGIFLTEIGQYKVNATILIGGASVSEKTASFKADPRITMHLGSDEISVIQGESTNIQLNLAYTPASPDSMIVRLSGRPLSSNVSTGITFSHGYNNITLTIAAREAVLAGEYDLTLTIVPTTMEYIAGEAFIRIQVTPGYDITLIEAPDTMTQGSTAEIVLQLRSHRSITVSGTLRTQSSNVAVRGETSFTVAAGETQQITLRLEETSNSPYIWGKGEIKVSLIRNGFPVLESQSIAIFVSINAANLFFGYILPPTLLVAILIDQLRKTKVKLTAIGTVLGGSISFACGLAISQSLFMAIPLAMMVAGCYTGTRTMEYVYDKPLPKGYDWFTPLEPTEDRDDNRQIDNKRAKQQRRNASFSSYKGRFTDT